jgi:hypothetical protein
MRERPTTPPTTPPMIAPVSFLEPVSSPDCCCIAVSVGTADEVASLLVKESVLLGGGVSLDELVLSDDDADVEPSVFCSVDDAVVSDEASDVVDVSDDSEEEDGIEVVGEDESESVG